ncbi:damage-inducible protein DinB [Rhizobium sp. Leaf384]|uniref:DinB family protein n=1 Tax=unclassified Rhizobium TaxID=2613769 RepID=UPI0007151584|nr:MULTISPECIES: DinB family protein [unclassified Rhizobium]KQR68760.1 damage-inducible protein DinB [Rhizobium sp. Leaf341]KQS79171.1 damage-inducible protein DinB [Rhizobium sp. Leaf384]KQS82739.1 damage-inducible protein DinB [Rhizobium sp. Leaf383]
MSAKTLLMALAHYKYRSDDEILRALASCEDDVPTDTMTAARRVLHHAHLVDTIFAAHLQRRTHDFRGSWQLVPPSLDELSQSMRDIDTWYIAYITGVTDADLDERIDFTFTDGQKGRMSREEMLAHVITHGGYHRGEVGRLVPDIEATAMRDVFAGYLHAAEPERRQPSM